MRKPYVLADFGGEPVSQELAPLLAAVYAEVQTVSTDFRALREALRSLLEFLASSEGRTNANCVAADSFFSRTDEWSRDWTDLPDSYQEVFADLGGLLHDTVSAPAIAENFESTPEQLLQRAVRLPARG